MNHGPNWLFLHYVYYTSISNKYWNWLEIFFERLYPEIGEESPPNSRSNRFIRHSRHDVKLFLRGTNLSKYLHNGLYVNKLITILDIIPVIIEKSGTQELILSLRLISEQRSMGGEGSS